MTGGFNEDKEHNMMRTKPDEAIFGSGTADFAEPQELAGFAAAASISRNEAHSEMPQNDSAQSASHGNGFQSSYADRIRQTPSLESNRWAGKRGETICAPQSDAAKQMLQERGIAGVQYRNGVPDFSPFSESTVKLGYMTDARHSRGLAQGRDGKNTIYAHFEDGKLVSKSHCADKNSMSDLHMKYDEPGNFEQADILTAEQWTADGRDARKWTAEDVAQYRRENGLTWHECNDGETMQMIPEAINADFGHLGGVAEVKKTQRIIDEVLCDDEDQILEDEDYDTMSPENVESFKYEYGHYDEEGIWISDEPVEPVAGETVVDETTQNPLGAVETGLDAGSTVEAEMDENANEGKPSLDLSDNDENGDLPVDEKVDADGDALTDKAGNGDVLSEDESQIDEKFDAADVDLNKSDFDEEFELEEVEEQGAAGQAAQETAEQEIDEQIEQETIDDYEEESDCNDLVDESSDESMDDLNYSDLADESSDESVDDPDYSDLADDSLDESMDDLNYSDLADESSDKSVDDADYSDLVEKTTTEPVDEDADYIDPGTFDGGDNPIE